MLTSHKLLSDDYALKTCMVLHNIYLKHPQVL